MVSSFEVEAMIRGYHQYKADWDAQVGEQLQCLREMSNPHDIYAIAILKLGVVVCYIPQKISSICSSFLQRGGTIQGTITGVKRYSADLE